MRSNGASTPKHWTRRAAPCPAAAGSRASTCPPAPASVWTRMAWLGPRPRSPRARAACRIPGLANTLALLRALAARPEMHSQQPHTRWLESVLPQLLAATENTAQQADETSPGDPGGQRSAAPPAGSVPAPMAARLVQRSVAEGDTVAAGAELAVLEAMKMEHLLLAPHAGQLRAWL